MRVDDFEPRHFAVHCQQFLMALQGGIVRHFVWVDFAIIAGVENGADKISEGVLEILEQH